MNKNARANHTCLPEEESSDPEFSGRRFVIGPPSTGAKGMRQRTNFTWASGAVGRLIRPRLMMATRRRILIAKQGSRGLSAILKQLDSRQADVVAFRDRPPFFKNGQELEIDTCLIDLRMLRRMLKRSPDELGQIRKSGSIVLMLGDGHLPKAHRFSDVVDGFVLVDRMLVFINECLMLARHGHCLLPGGMLSALAAPRLRIATLASLSEDERAILAHLAGARTNQAISVAMKISEAAVKALVRSVLTKLDLMNRTEAAIFATRQNLSAATQARGPRG